MKNVLIYIAVLVLVFCFAQWGDKDSPPNYDDGYASGYEYGYKNGYLDGCADGHAEGWAAALEQYGIEE